MIAKIASFLRRVLLRHDEPRVTFGPRENSIFKEQPDESTPTPSFRRYDLNNYSRPSLYPAKQIIKADPSPPEGERHFFQQVHGVYYRNDDGSSRQSIIRNCHRGDELRLVPEPENPHGSNATKVCRLNGEQLGYLSSEFAARYVNETAMGWTYRVTVEDVFATNRAGSYGCKIRFEVLTMSYRTEERKRKAQNKNPKI